VSGKLRLTLAAVAAALAALAPATAQAATPEFFPLPESRGTNAGIVADSSGNVWFGANAADSFTEPPELARLTPSLAVPGTSDGISYFHTPSAPADNCCGFSMFDVAFDAENQRIWFVRSRGTYGYGTPGAMVPGTSSGMQVAQAPGVLELGGIAIAPGGTAWLTENSANSTGPAYAGNRIASTNAGLALDEYADLWHQTGVPADSSRFDAGPAGVTIGKDGAPWFAEDNPGFPGYRLARASSGLYQEYQVKPCVPAPATCSGSNTGIGVLSVTTAADGSIWFTNVLKNSFGRFDPGSSTFTQYSLPAIDPDLFEGQPRSIRVAPDGTLWLAEFGFISHPKANAIVRIVPTDPPTATVYKLGAGKAPLSIAPDGQGNVWFGINGEASGYVGRLAGVLGATLAPGDPGAGGSGPGGPGTVPPPGAKVVKPSGAGFARVNDPELRKGALRLTQICVGPPEDRCSLIYLLDSYEYVNGLPGTKPRARTTKRVVVGSKAVTLNGGESATVTIKLNTKGKKILKRDGVLHLTFHASQKQGKGKPKVLKTKKLTIKSSTK
jgi:streptogramin lyase